MWHTPTGLGDNALGVLLFWGGGVKTLIMTDQSTMQLNQVSLSKNVECTLYLTLVLFTAKARLTGPS